MRKWIDLMENASPLPIAATPENLALAKEFVFEKWKERAEELGRDEPIDLSSSCKFTSQFVQKVFGGTIEGNYDHQFVRLNGHVIDLNIDAQDVRNLIDDDDDPHYHDTDFFGSPDHRDSMDSCLPRVNEWVTEFVVDYL